MKRKLSLLLAMVLAMTMVMMMRITTFAIPSGTGTWDNPYRISSLTDGDALPIPGSGTGFTFENDTTKAMFILVDDPDHVTKVCFNYKNEAIGDCGYNLIRLAIGSKTATSIEKVDPSGIAVIKVKMEEDPIVPIPTVLNGSQAPAPVPDVPVHIHEFTEGTIYEATCDHDGLEGTYCSTCGFIKESSPISAFGYTLDTYAQQKMDVAKSGQNIVLEFGELSSFPKSFMEKIAEKVAAGVSFEFRYKVNHKLQKIKIPAYSTVDTSLDWYGHDKMAELYGMN